LQIIVDNIVTNYETEGAGRTLLMIHGWGSSSKTFDGLTDKLKRKYCVVRLDLPGFGGSSTPTQDYNLEKYANFIATFLSKIDKENLYAIIGHSNGGAIAIKGIANKTLHAKKLILLACSGVRSTNKTRKKITRIVAKTIKVPLMLLPNRIQKRVKRKAYYLLGSDIFIAENMAGTFKNVVGEDILGLARSINIKTVLIYGVMDEVTPLKYGELIHQNIRTSVLYKIEDADHFVHRSKPQEVYDLIVKALK